MIQISIAALMRCFHKHGKIVSVEPLPGTVSSSPIICIQDCHQHRIYYDLERQGITIAANRANNTILKMIENEKDLLKNSAGNTDSAAGTQCDSERVNDKTVFGG